MTTHGVTIANAPISYGAFELTVGTHPDVPDSGALLDLVADAGYAGIDLGPVGYLGRNSELEDALSSRELGLAGGYLELPFSDPVALDGQMDQLATLLDTFDEACTRFGPPPKATLADGGAPHRRNGLGRSASDRSLGLDDAAWGRFADGMAIVIEYCHGRGYEPTLHPEAGTYIEAEWEIDRALEVSDIGLCLETGHQVVGGGDPLVSLRRWGDRVNHVHIKDVKVDIIEAIVAASGPVEDIWNHRAFCPLGEGDVALSDILATLDSIRYSGWLVVEQDIMPGPGDPANAQAAQIANRELLRSNGF
jgi:inosose dehydratase